MVKFLPFCNVENVVFEVWKNQSWMLVMISRVNMKLLIVTFTWAIILFAPRDYQIPTRSLKQKGKIFFNIVAFERNGSLSWPRPFQPAQSTQRFLLSRKCEQFPDDKVHDIGPELVALAISSVMSTWHNQSFDYRTLKHLHDYSHETHIFIFHV